MSFIKTKLLPVPAPEVEVIMSYASAVCLRDMMQNSLAVAEDATTRGVREALFHSLSAVVTRKTPGVWTRVDPEDLQK